MLTKETKIFSFLKLKFFPFQLRVTFWSLLGPIYTVRLLITRHIAHIPGYYQTRDGSAGDCLPNSLRRAFKKKSRWRSRTSRWFLVFWPPHPTFFIFSSARNFLKVYFAHSNFLLTLIFFCSFSAMERAINAQSPKSEEKKHCVLWIRDAQVVPNQD